VKILLKWESVDPDREDTFLVGKECEGALELLLERHDANPNKPDHSGKLPPSFATEKRRERVLGVLLGRKDVDPNRPNTILVHSEAATTVE